MTRHFLVLTLSMLAVLLVATAPADAARRYKVKVDTVPSGAKIYLETRQADPVGTTPQVFRLERGEYTFILELDGYEPFSRKVKIRKAATFTFTLTRKAAPAQLTIESAPGAKVDGATVKINGKEVGKVPVPVSLSKGRYLVEVVKDGFKPFRKWINVAQGEKKTMAVALVSTTPQTGTLLAHSTAPGAVIYLDGRKVDRAPALVQKLKVGKYAVEARAKGYQPKSVEVQIEAGKTAKVTIHLELTSAAKTLGGGTIQVVAKPKRVEIFVDGKSKGLAPVKVLGLTPGSHHVEGRRDGHVSEEKTVVVKKGEFKTIKLSLKEKVPPKRTGALRVISPLEKVLVFIDGSLVGKTPLLKHQIVPGPHFVTARKKGYEDQVQTVNVKAGKIVELKIMLVKEKQAPASAPASAPTKGKGKDEKPLPRPPFGMASYGAQLVGPWNFTADVSLGFAHFFEARLNAGLFYKGFFGIDAGVEFRTFGAMSEIGLHSKFRVLNINPFAVAVLFDIGGGGGPASRGTFYTNLGVSGSMWFKKLVTFTARIYLNIYSDRLCPEENEPGNEVDVCVSEGSHPEGLDHTPRERISGVRLFMSAIVEVPVHQRINLFGILEGAPGTSRWAFRDAFAAVMPENDASIYGRVGVTFKF